MCPACHFKRLHTAEDWKNHPWAGHGYNGTSWSHPDLVPARGLDTRDGEPNPK
jgi:hypothetical protein